VSLTRFLDDKPVFLLSSITGLTSWVDYIPVQYDSAASPRRFDNDGAYAISALLDNVSGLSAWKDYTPAYLDSTATERSSASALGYIPIIEQTPTDQYFSSVVSLLHFDGADAGTTFTDQKGLTWTGANTAQLDTAQKKWGTASLLTDTTNDRITTPDTTTWEMGSSDFTVECWIRWVTDPASARFVSKWTTTGDQREWRLGYVGGTGLQFGYSTDGTVNTSRNGAWTPVKDTWYHVCGMRSGTTIYLFADGAALGNGVIGTLFEGTATPCISDGVSDGFGIDGWIDDVRVTKGVARYAVTGFQRPVRAFPNA